MKLRIVRVVVGCLSQRWHAVAAGASVLLLLGAISAPAHAQSVTFEGIQTVLGSFYEPYGVAVDGAGDVFVTEPASQEVLEVPAGGGAPIVVPYANYWPYGVAVDGTGDVFYTSYYLYYYATFEDAYLGGEYYGSDALATGEDFGVAVDAAGDVFIAGNGEVVKLPYLSFRHYGTAITVPASGLSLPYGVAVDGAGDVFIADAGNNQVVEVTAAGVQTTVASGLSYPTGVAVDGAGNVFIADADNRRVVEVPAGGGAPVTVVVGVGLYLPWGVAVDGAGNVFIVDANSGRVVKVHFGPVNFGNVNVCPAGQTTPAPCRQTLTLTYSVAAATTFGATNVLPSAPNLDFTLGSGNTCTGTVSAGSTCTVSVIFAPLAPGARVGAVQLTDSSGNLLAATLVHGQGQGPTVAFGPSVQTPVNTGSYMLNNPPGVAVDAAGDVFIADELNSRVVKVPAGGGPQTTVGSGLSQPSGVAVDGAGDVFIADARLGQVVEVPAGGGAQTTVGSGLSQPKGVALDAAGDLFIADSGLGQVVKVPVGGLPARGIAASGGPQTTVGSGLSQPSGVAVDAAGDVFIADAGLGQVVEVPAGGGPQTTVGSGLSQPKGVALDAAGDVFIADELNNRVVEVQRSQPPTLSFAPTPVGSLSSDSPRSVTIQNIGNQPLNGAVPSAVANFVQMEVSGTPPDCTSAFALAPGASCNLNIGFLPESAGSLTAAAIFTDNALNASPLASQSITLQGTGQATQAITFTTNAPPSATYNSSFIVAATGGASGNPVTFTSSGVCGNLGATYTMTSGTGTCSVIANQAGNTNYSAAPTVTQLLAATTASQTITFPTIPNQTYGGTVTLYASAGSGLTVSYTVIYGPATVNGNTLTITGAGSVTVQASQAGNANYSAATPVSQTFTVNPANSSTALTSSLNPSEFGQLVTFTATVTSQYQGMVSGTVDFKSGAVSLGSAMLANGQASIDASFSTPGTHSITAKYLGDANNTGSTSPALKQVVSKYPSSTAVVSNLNPSMVGQEVTFTVTVTVTTNGIPTGTVTFKSGGTALGTVSLTGNTASLSTSALTAGTRSITAVYSGDGTFKASTSPALKQVVDKYPSSTTIASSLNPSMVGQAVTFTATVTTNGIPTGTVTFKSGGTALGTVSLTGNTASLSTSALTAGTRSITAVYSGDGTFKGSTSPALEQVVN